MNVTMPSTCGRARIGARACDIHVPLTYLHGRELLLAYPQADADIVIPAILLHDVGWTAVPEEQQGRVFGAIKDQSLLRFHETEGARIAGEILSAVGYDMQQSAAIVSIIDGHDTRLEPLSLEDSLVKDADKVWRYTPVGIEFYQRSVGKPPVEHVPWLARQIDRWFFTDRGKQLAREELSHVQLALAEIGHV